MNGWKNYLLGDLLTFISKGTTPPKGVGFADKGVNYIKSESIDNNRRIDISKLSYITPELHNSYKRSQLKEDDILFSMAGFLGKNTVIKKSILPANTNQAIAILRVNRDMILPNFLSYYLSQSYMIEYINNMSAQSVQPNINFQEIKSIPVSIPNLKVQRVILDVLSNLDDKIDLLQRQNATVEAMAEALFKKWFVVEAKEEWEERTIGEVVEIKGGSTPRTKNLAYWNGDIPWSSPRDLTGKKDVFLLSTERSISEAGLAQISSGLLPKGTLLLSSRAPIGYLAITDIELAINQGYIAILNNSYISNYYMYLWCKYNMDEIKAAGNGSVFQEISKSVFRQLPFLLPSKNTLSDFNGMIEPYFQKIHSNQIQIQTLEKLRDMLLPKLMSGGVRVSLD